MGGRKDGKDGRIKEERKKGKTERSKKGSKDEDNRDKGWLRCLTLTHSSLQSVRKKEEMSSFPTFTA